MSDLEDNTRANRENPSKQKTHLLFHKLSIVFGESDFKSHKNSVPRQSRSDQQLQGEQTVLQL